jgi:TolB-like protein
VRSGGRGCRAGSHDIPPPFDSLHTELLSNRAAIEAALTKLGIAPSRAIDSVRVEDATTQPTLMLPEKPSIAILPFENMSLDPEQDYFADGMVEEITAALSRMRWLFVISCNSSFSYKGQTIDVGRMSRELGVRYLLRGSVRKAANRLRITGQLIDASTGVNLWADRFEGDVEDVFELQDRVTLNVVGAVAPKLEQAEIERSRRKPTESLNAYDCYLRGIASIYRWDQEGIVGGLKSLYRAIELDPEFSSAYGLAALCYYLRRVNGWTTDRHQEITQVIDLARSAAEFGRDDAVALSYGGLALTHVVGDPAAGVVLIDRALALNPNLAAAWYASGSARSLIGDPDTAIEHLSRAMRLSPLDPLMFYMLSYSALAHFFAERYDEASRLAERACRATIKVRGARQSG